MHTQSLLTLACCTSIDFKLLDFCIILSDKSSVKATESTELLPKLGPYPYSYIGHQELTGLLNIAGDVCAWYRQLFVMQTGSWLLTR